MLRHAVRSPFVLNGKQSNMLTTLGSGVANVTDTLNVSALPTEKADFNKAAVADIVGLIREKYTEEGLRSFAIGKRFFEHAQWQKGNFSGVYQTGDFDSLARHVREEVRLYVPIKAESIRVADWARCHVLRELIAKEISAEHASMLTMFEYLAIVGKALKFTVADLEGDLNPCWLDMVKGVVADRAKENGRVTREDFENRIALTFKKAADAKLQAMDPAKAAAKIASDKVKASAASVAKSVKDITTAIDTGLASGAISPEGALAVLEGVAKHHGKPLVSATIGLDPATATCKDWETAVDIAFTNGKIVEMKAAMAHLAKRIAQAEKALTGGVPVKAPKATPKAEKAAA